MEIPMKMNLKTKIKQLSIVNNLRNLKKQLKK